MIRASAPVRICDNGGWTDTWFGGPGRVLNVAVSPGVEVTIDPTEGPDRVILELDAFGGPYPVVPGRARSARSALVEAAIDAFAPPAGGAVKIRIGSSVPSGCGTGTSAAVAVALIGGLASLRAGRPSLNEVAYAAHRLEVVTLGLESGIQDQLCSSYGGISFIEIDRYPQATVETLPMWEELSELLRLFFVAAPMTHLRSIGR
jgi:D-glycero-alpha-D-manno-heptose-7-phosphate kinase